MVGLKLILVLVVCLFDITDSLPAGYNRRARSVHRQIRDYLETFPGLTLPERCKVPCNSVLSWSANQMYDNLHAGYVMMESHPIRDADYRFLLEDTRDLMCDYRDCSFAPLTEKLISGNWQCGLNSIYDITACLS